MPLYKTGIPTWIPFAALTAACSCLTITLAITHLPHFEVNKALAARIQALVCFLLALLLWDGLHYSSMTYRTGTNYLFETFCTYIAWAILGVCLAVLPIFATGELRLRHRGDLILLILAGLNPRRWFSGHPASALPYIALWLLGGLAWSWLSLGLVGSRPGDVVKVALLVKIGAIGLVSLAAYSAVGLFFSLLTSRYFAMIATYAALLLLVVVPLMILAPAMSQLSWGAGMPPAQARWENYLLCLNPFLAVFSVSQPAEFAKSIPPLKALLPFWQLSLALHALLGAAALVATQMAGASITRGT